MSSSRVFFPPDHLSRFPVEILFSTAEKFMMASKAWIFGDMEIYNQMMETDDPKIIKALGRKVKGFRDDIWLRHCLKIVTCANYYKMTQSQELVDFMKSVAGKEFVEGSPMDKIWGVGLSWDDPLVLDRTNWLGENRLGRCLNMCWVMMQKYGLRADPYQAFDEMISQGYII